MLCFEPLSVERPWGGRRLAEFGRRLPADRWVGESWEIADLGPGGDGGERCTRVATGPLAGSSPADLIDAYGEGLLGSVAPDPHHGFPLLVKLLDARENLSVQVHPPAAVAEALPDARTKTESWYVVRADPGSVAWFDIRDEVSNDELHEAIGSPGIVPLLGRAPAQAGEFHHIPAGRVHALGAGVLVLEVQTPSDTTFRLYDWSEEYSRPPRSIHVAEARQSIVRSDPAAISREAMERPGARDLVRGPAYWMRQHVAERGRVHLDGRSEMRVVTVVAGEASVGDVRLGMADSCLLPASSSGLGVIETSEGAVVVESGLA